VITVDSTDTWRRLVLPAVCNVGGESLDPGTIVRRVHMNQIVKGTHVCRDHVQDTDDTRREDELGDWFIADFNGECSRGGGMFLAGSTIRADGDGGWECQACVEFDQQVEEARREAAS
jgi:hypothetical protein